MRTQLLPCPACEGVAEVDWRARRQGRGPSAQLVKVQCIRRHWFLMPLDQLDWYPEAENGSAA